MLLTSSYPDLHLSDRGIWPSHFSTDTRLFYIGPCKQYMRLVVMSEEEKRHVLEQCHHNPGTGNHNGVRGTKKRVISGYFWPTLAQDVADWVKCCHQCQMNDPIKTVAPVLHSIKVLGLDLIGPLPETSRGNPYVLTMTDLYTKWVIAEPVQSKAAHEVSLAVTTKLYMFGMVRKMITDQGKGFVNEVHFFFLNFNIFFLISASNATLLIILSSAYHPQTNGQVTCSPLRYIVVTLLMLIHHIHKSPTSSSFTGTLMILTLLTQKMTLTPK
uniref:Integrase catalytic domain-containing protein n=1 Tax=Paramormyrops kingsleyae TaxID=1676925 RepID=A0A3B3QAG7_9TELE